MRPSVYGIYPKNKERIYSKSIYDNALYIKMTENDYQACPVQRYAREKDRLSEEERRVDALALRAEERRDKLR